MGDWREDRIAAAERGENPLLMAHMSSGFAVIGDTQFLPGYGVLLASPQVEQLTDLSSEEQLTFLRDMSLIGQAIMAVCKPRRINYAILGNTDHYLHAHVEARYDWEPDEYRRFPTFSYPRALRADPQHQYSDEQHGELRVRLTARLLSLIRADSQ